MKLQLGDPAPQFKTPDHAGTLVNLAQYRGKWVLLSFYRYASCPFCNLRVHQLSQQAEQLHSLNLSLIGVFQSPAKGIVQHAGGRNLSFPLLPDPTQGLYRLYSLETSWWGVIAGMMFKMPILLQAMLKGYLPGRIEGKFTQMPADFLINPAGEIALAKYGKDLGDHLSLEAVLGKIAQTHANSLAQEAG